MISFHFFRTLPFRLADQQINFSEVNRLTKKRFRL